MNPAVTSSTSIRFSIGVSGRGPLVEPFIDSIKHCFKRARIYNRFEEANRDDSHLALPPHPEVADVEVFIGASGPRTTITLRSRNGHRYFSCKSNAFLEDTQGMDRFIVRIAKCVPELL